VRNPQFFSKRFIYALTAFLMGTGLVIVSFIIHLDQTNSVFSPDHIFDAFLQNRLLAIIATTPFVLSTISYLLGQIQDRLEQTTARLNETISERDQELRYQHEFFQALAKNSPLAFVKLDKQHMIISTNQVFEDLFGYTEAEVLGRSLDELLTSSEQIQQARAITKNVMDGKVTRSTGKRKKANGELVDVDIIGIPVFERSEQIGVIGLYLDISQQVAAEKKLAENEARYRSLFEDSPISLWEEDYSGVKAIIDEIRGSGVSNFEVYFTEHPEQVKECLRAVKLINVNESTMQLYRATQKEELLESLDSIVQEDGHEQFMVQLIKLSKAQYSFTYEISQHKVDGEVFFAELSFSIPEEFHHSWEKVYISIIDITDRKKAKEELVYLSFHDSLTGLYNFAYFNTEIKRLEHSRLYPVTIIMCDMNNLKQINDTYGHQAGDRAIQAIADVLSKVFRSEDVVARIGGDEFAIVLPRNNEQNAKAIVDRINREITRSNKNLSDYDLEKPLSISIGIATMRDGESLDEGLKLADERMYKNKAEMKRARLRSIN